MTLPTNMWFERNRETKGRTVTLQDELIRTASMDKIGQSEPVRIVSVPSIEGENIKSISTIGGLLAPSIISPIVVAPEDSNNLVLLKPKKSSKSKSDNIIKEAFKM